MPTAVPGADQPLVIDPAITRGVLDNGVRYLIRQNDSPGRSAEFRLVVDAGSAIETDEQLGAAHLLEHMMFNGTEEYPGNELITRLELLGTSFGADLNAYTSYDETVYSLSVRNDVNSMRQALAILEQWAGHALILDDDVEAERGVVAAEWRSRRAGVQGRSLAFIEQTLLDGTPYENRSPVANEKAILTIDPEEIRAFYDDWYRPDLITVIAVGDFTSADIEDMIKEEFAGLESRSSDNSTSGDSMSGDSASGDSTSGDPLRVREPYLSRSELQAEVFRDEELTSSFAEVVFPGPKQVLISSQDIAHQLRIDVALQQIRVRLSDRIARGELPGARVYVANDSFVSTSDVRGLGISATPADFEVVLEALFEEIERMRRFGSTEQETSVSVEQRRAEVESRIESRPTKQDNDHADDLIRFATTASAAAIAEGVDAEELAILDTLKAADVTAGFQAYIGNRPPAIMVFGPDDVEWFPGPLRADNLWKLTQADPVDRYEPPEQAPELLMEPPDPVPSTASEIDLGATQLMFENGATVILHRTGISLDKVHFTALSPGGDSVIDPADVKRLALISAVADGSGLGPHDPATVAAILRDDVLSLSTFVSFEVEALTGTSSSGDLEDLMAATHLLMTEPRADDVAFSRLDLSLRPVLEDPSISPSQSIGVAWGEMRYGGDERFQPLNLEALDSLTADDLSLFLDRFNNPADFTFIFVGDLDIATATDLAQRYIGSLEPRLDGNSNVNQAREEVAWNLIPEPPAGVVTRTVEAGQSDLGSLVIRHAQKSPGDAGDPVAMELLRESLAVMVRDEFRERLGAAYAPSVAVRYEHDDEARIRTEIRIEADPADLPAIEQGVAELLAAVAADGIPPETFDAAASILGERYRFVSNEDWLGEFESLALIGRPVLTPGAKRSLLGQQSADTLNAFASALLNPDQYIAIQQVPLPAQ